MNAVSVGLTPPPAKWPHTLGITRSSAFGMCETAHSSSSGGKYRSVLPGITMARAVIEARASSVEEKPAVKPTSPCHHVFSMDRALLASRSRKKPSQKLTRKSSTEVKPISFHSSSQ